VAARDPAKLPHRRGRRRPRSATTLSRRYRRERTQRSRRSSCQFPGVTQDSAAGANFHVRNEHANVQVRINGIMLPDGVSGFGTFLDTALIGNISLIHRRSAAAIRPAHLRRPRHPDAQRRLQQYRNRRHLRRQPGNVYPKLEYGGTVGQTQYFFTGRFSRAISAWRIRRRAGTPSTTTPSRREGSATSRPCSTPIRGSPSLLAPLTRASRFPTPQACRRTSAPSASPASIRRYSTRTSSSKTILALRPCNARSTALTCNSLISRDTATIGSIGGNTVGKIGAEDF
jgi:hypothetical protein